MEIKPLNKVLNTVNSSELRQQLFLATFWSLLGGVLARGLTFLSFIVVARALGKELLGELAIIQSTAIMISTFAAFGLSLTASKHVAEYRNRNPEKVARILKLSNTVALVSGILFAGLLLVFSTWLSREILAAPHLDYLLKISAIMLLFLALDGAQAGALIGFEAFKVTAKLNFIKGVVTFIVLVIGVYLDGLRGVTIGLVISSIVGWFINRIALNKEIKRYSIPVVSLKQCKNEFRILWEFSLPSAVSGALIAPTLWACSAMLVNEPSGYEELGIYDVANRFYQIMIFLGVSIGAPLLPILASSKFSTNDKVRKVNVLLTWGFGLVAIFPLMLFPEIIEWMFGDKYSGHDLTKTMGIMLLAACLVLYKQGLARALAVENLLWWGALSNLFWAILMLFFAYMLVKFGALGLSVTLLISYFLNTVVVIPLYLKRNIIPRKTMLSFEAFVIWCITIIPIFLVWIEVSIFIRGVFFVLGMMTLSISFYKLYVDDSS